MCRLFGLHAGTSATRATFWLLEAPDNLAAQSRRNPDGTGIGVFGSTGLPQVHKEPIAAWHDCDFATEARELTGTTFIAHVRYATTGALSAANTHPFLQDGRIFAHNGVVQDLDVIDRRLDELGTADLVRGQTDSERIFALITGYIRAGHGDVEAGLREAISWLAANVAVYALNILLSTATDMWALRYPDTNELYLLDRGGRPDAFDLRTPRIRARCERLPNAAAAVIATERMDDDPNWRLMASGELIHVDAGLTVTAEVAFPSPPARLLRRQDLGAAGENGLR